jgi:hypothetical protein
MSKIEEAQEILKSLGLPTAQQNEMSALTLLALCNIKETDSWVNASRQSLGVTKGVMTFVADNYNKPCAQHTGNFQAASASSVCTGTYCRL